MSSNDVFISYRRDVAGFVALALQQHLTGSEVDAFYDIDSIRTGQFDTIILNQIEARPYFVLVLTPGTLDRCVDPGDWLRREIEHAVGTGRKIVPVHTPEFVFDDLEQYLPLKTGRELARWQALELPHKYFRYAAAELVDEYLVPVDDVAVTPTPASDRVEVQRVREETAAAPVVTPTQLSAQEHFERAYKHQKADDLDGAVADYDQAIKLDPTYIAAFNNRGNARQDRGDLDGAVADYDQAIKLDPTNSTAFNNRGIVRKARGDLDGAVADYDQAIKLDPTNNTAFYNRGNARQDRGDLDGAVADYDQAIKLAPTNSLAFYNRGTVRKDRGDLDGAVADFRAGKVLAPDDPDFDRQLESMQSEDEAG